MQDATDKQGYGAHSIVFVVDDDESMRKALSNLVRSVGLKVEAFASAPEFLAVKPPDGPCCLDPRCQASRAEWA